MKLAKPQRFGPVAFIVVILLIGTGTVISIDMYAPALPSMKAEFGTSESYLNMTMFFYLLFAAFGMLLVGPLSDRHGRKPLMVGSVALFTLSSLGCALSPSIEVLTVLRVLEAIAQGSVFTLSTVLVQDAYDEESTQFAQTLLQSLVIVGPIAAPFLGSFVLMFTSWRGIFYVLAGIGVIALVLALIMEETLSAEERTPRGSRMRDELFGGMAVLVHDRKVISLALIMGIAAVPLFAFIASTSYAVIDFFGASYLVYSIVYAVVTVGSVTAPFLYLRLSRRMSVGGILWVCIALLAASALLLFAIGVRNPWLYMISLIPLACAEAMVRPMGFVVVLDQPPERVGAASSLANLSAGIFQSIATLVGTLGFWPNFVVSLGWISLVSLVLIALLGIYGRLREVPAS